MPFHERDVFGDAVNKIRHMPILNSIFGNPLFTAVIITFIIMLIIFVVFADVEPQDDDTSLYKLTFRAGIYSFLVTTAFVFINNFFLQERLNEEQKEGGYDEIFSSFDDSTNENMIPIDE